MLSTQTKHATLRYFAANLATFLIVMLLPLLFIGIGYYWDYRQDKKSFTATFKSITLVILKYVALAATLSMGGKYLYQLIPLNRNFGFGYNEIRKQTEVPLIEPCWAISSHNGDKYEEWWYDTMNTDNSPHSLKIIQYNLFGPTQELDYFSKPESPYRLASCYDYSSQSLSYSKIGSPINTASTYMYSAPLPGETITSISKDEFYKLLKEWQHK